ncbi:transporter substrate-binding domain-containing protein [Clostridium sp. Cult3]|uniref:transporter substrate-binding domain-containing protein n=1 Tax=Clostridium sp. Cult3 TaxID=2079004 RepID=UPI001F3646C1|nr:transporter substrate-binding domain-containing protein [Clostridium sp. Cult3]MCF6459691.1 hypothetical protein [Clostridium sp. Cult3]
MKRNRLVYLLIMVLTIAIVFTGCGKEEDVSSNEPNETNEQAKVEKVIKVGAKEDGQPYIFKEDGVVKGFEADMWKEICKRTGWEIEYEFNSISGLFGLLDNGQIDTISHFLGKTEQRLEKYDFTDTYAHAVLQLMVKSDADEIKNIEDLYGKTVGVALGSAAAGVIQDLDPDGKIELKPYEEFRNIPQDVEMERIDAYFGNTITMLGDIEKMDLDCKINPLVLHATEVAYPFRKDDEESAKIIEELNKVLKEMNEDGTIAKLSEKWLKIDVTSFNND